VAFHKTVLPGEGKVLGKSPPDVALDSVTDRVAYSRYILAMDGSGADLIVDQQGGAATSQAITRRRGPSLIILCDSHGLAKTVIGGPLMIRAQAGAGP
jgi:hypothetical protein